MLRLRGRPHRIAALVIVTALASAACAPGDDPDAFHPTTQLWQP